MRVEPIEKCSEYFNHKKDNPYMRIPFEKRYKNKGKTFKEIFEELNAKKSF